MMESASIDLGYDQKLDSILQTTILQLNWLQHVEMVKKIKSNDLSWTALNANNL